MYLIILFTQLFKQIRAIIWGEGVDTSPVRECFYSTSVNFSEKSRKMLLVFLKNTHISPVFALLSAKLILVPYIFLATPLKL